MCIPISPVADQPPRRHVLALLGLGAGIGALASCTDQGRGEGSNGPMVITTCYPTAFLAQHIGGDRLDVVNLATPGADAHGLELSVRQVAQMQEADLVVHIPGYQAAVDDAIASHGDANVLDVSTAIELLPAADASAEHDHDEQDHEGHDHGVLDPHFWHDPMRMADLGDALAARLGDLAPQQAQSFTEAATALRAELEQLDADLAESFSGIEGQRPFITSHAAYAYLAERYDLKQIGISGVDPEVEPSPQRLLELEKVIQDEAVTTIFFETTASPKVAQTLAENVGIDAEELDNLETQLSETADYPQVMRDNAETLIASWT